MYPHESPPRLRGRATMGTWPRGYTGARFGWEEEPSQVFGHMVTCELPSATIRSHHEHRATWHHGTSSWLGRGATMEVEPCGDTGARLVWEAEPPQTWSHEATWDPTSPGRRSHHERGPRSNMRACFGWDAELPRVWGHVVTWEPDLKGRWSPHEYNTTW
jgi:hypothetical protein